MTPANRYRTNDNLGSLAYVKPSHHAARAAQQGARRRRCSTRAFREYTRRWAFKHPQPADFFRTIEEVSGRDLAVVLARLLLHHRGARPERSRA